MGMETKCSAGMGMTRNSAVAMRPRDVSCLSVVSFVASIVQHLYAQFLSASLYFSKRGAY